MYNDGVKHDLRVTKTYNILLAAIGNMLKIRNFKRLTVNDICIEAQISRATFYTHFKDKYDLLEYWLNTCREKITFTTGTYEDTERSFNEILTENQRAVKNLLEEADDETTLIIFNFIVSMLDLSALDNKYKIPDAEYVVLTNVLAGGIISYFNWHIKSKFSSSTPVMNVFFYEIVKMLKDWHNQNNRS